MTTEKLVDNKLLIIAGRIAIIVATSIFLPLAGAMLHRIAGAADAIASKVDNTAVQLQLLDASMKFRVENAETKIADHEGRIRVIERATPSVLR